MRPVQQPRVTVWLLKDVAAKLALAEQLAAQPVAGRTLIFVQRLHIGQELARRLQLPFVSGETTNRQRVFQEHRMVIASSVGDEGMSIGGQDDDLTDRLERIIEVDFWMGSRRQAGQRVGRLANQPTHATEPGQHHVLMTREEYVSYGKRLLVYEQWGLDLDVKVAYAPGDAVRSAPRAPVRPRRERRTCRAPPPWLHLPDDRRPLHRSERRGPQRRRRSRNGNTRPSPSAIGRSLRWCHASSMPARSAHSPRRNSPPAGDYCRKRRKLVSGVLVWC